jgi:hypothetical protein
MAEQGASSGFRGRFTGFYVVLAAGFVAGVAGAVVLATQPGKATSGPWSTWKPAHGSVQKETDEIAAHIGKGYTLNKSGAQLVGIVTEPPQITQYTDVAKITNVCTLTSLNAQSCTRLVPTSGFVQALLCGLGQECAIERGTATAARERLLRREALELALYTFKYIPSVSSLIAYMPPAPGQAPSTVLFLERANLSKQLSMPLSKTLPLTTPPLPSQADTKEQATIDKLTLPVEYSFKYYPQPNGKWLLLVPSS